MGPIHLNKLAQALYVPSAVLGALPALGVLSLVEDTLKQPQRGPHRGTRLSWEGGRTGQPTEWVPGWEGRRREALWAA